MAGEGDRFLRALGAGELLSLLRRLGEDERELEEDLLPREERTQDDLLVPLRLELRLLLLLMLLRSPLSLLECLLRLSRLRLLDRDRSERLHDDDRRRRLSVERDRFDLAL